MERHFCDKCDDVLDVHDDYVWITMDVHDPRVRDLRGSGIYIGGKHHMKEYHPECYDSIKESIKI